MSVDTALTGLSAPARVFESLAHGEGLSTNGHHLDRRPARPALHSVSVTPSGTRCSVQVELRKGEDRALGLAEGVMATSVARRLVAEATIGALATMQPEANQVAIDAVAVGSVGAHSVVTVTVVLAAPPLEEILAGAAVVRSAGEHDAIARAALDAVNGRLNPA